MSADLDSLMTSREPFIFDTGPLYHEFHAENLIKEPWNAYSSLFFFIPVIYWLWRLKGEYKENKFLVAILPLLFLNGLGSTLFHAFRSNQLFLVLDFMPAMIMNIIVGTFFWGKVWGKWYWGLLSMITFFTLGFIGMSFFSSNQNLAPNIGYAIIGTAFLTPILILLFRTNFYKWHLIALTFLCLTLALFCRILDYPNPNPFPNVMPQGTHFLWHIISSFAVFFLGGYVYHINKNQK